MCSKRVMWGFSLIEMLVFIVIVGIAATAMLAVMGNLTRQSAGLLPEKQAQAIAAGLLDEILGQPHTFCDPDAPNAATATAASAAACGGDHENNLGPEAGETRGGATPFDNVNDYNGYGPVAVIFPDGSATTNLPGYVAQVQVQGAGTIAGVPAAQTLRVTVTVTAPNGVVARQEGVRIRYAPNT